MAYPKRPSHFAHRFCRLLTKVAAAQEIGADGCWFLSVIVHQEDARRYSGPVSFWNGQLQPLLGFESENRLIRVRTRLVDAGWLNHQSGARHKPALYFVMVPNGIEVDGSPIDEPAGADIQNGGQDGSQDASLNLSTSKMEVSAEVKRQSSGGASGGPSTLSLSLFPIPEYRTHLTPQRGESHPQVRRQ